MIHSGPFSCLNDSAGAYVLLEWFCRGIRYAWMIHSGPFRCLHDLFSCTLQNFLALMFSIRWCGEISIIFIAYEKHVWNWTYLMVWYKGFSSCTKMSNAYLQIDFVHTYILMLRQNSTLATASWCAAFHHMLPGVWAHGTSSRLLLRTNLVTMTAMPIPNGWLIQHNFCSAACHWSNSTWKTHAAASTNKLNVYIIIA
jgi:hypothetical protein